MTASNDETPARALASLPAACPRCEYDLSGCAGEICPECGGDIAAEFLARREAKLISPILIPLMAGVLGWGFGSLYMIAATASFMGRMLSPDPISLGVHGMTLATGGGGILTILFRRRLRRASNRAYHAILMASVSQMMIIGAILIIASQR